MKDSRFYLDNVVIPEGVISTSFGNNHSSEQPLFVNCGACINTPVKHINKNDHGRLDYQLLYMVSGQMQDILTNDKITVMPGDVIVIPPNTPWKFECTGDTIYFYCVHFTGSEVKSRLNEYGIELFPKKNKTCPDNEIPKRFHRLFDGFSKKDRLKNRDLASFLEGVLIETSRAIEKEEFDKAVLSKSIRYINEFYTTNIKIGDLAKMENMCVSLYNATFKKILGIPPTKYIIKLRMQYAIELLENGDMPISEIAIMCGYKDTNFFIRTFKSVLNV
ncbi:MAG: AraC family transcriptional regulator, partial [Clostridia bacterium]|nr:AraC family transcriptional regulator [Clostridia bacterium]